MVGLKTLMPYASKDMQKWYLQPYNVIEVDLAGGMSHTMRSKRSKTRGVLLDSLQLANRDKKSPSRQLLASAARLQVLLNLVSSCCTSL